MSDSKAPGGPVRDFVGYGQDTPQHFWPDNAYVAVNVVINYEEGSEYSYAGDGENDNPVEVTYNFPTDTRDLARESMYEYGSRAGVWRLFRVLEQHDIRATMFACAQAFELNPSVAHYARNAGFDLVSHGDRWIETWRYTRQEEREAMISAIESFRYTWGERPYAWYCRYGPSVNTRELLVEESGFTYDSDAYNDDLPYYVEVNEKTHLVVPYSLTYNDMQAGTPSDFLDYAKRGLDELWKEGEGGHPRMMSIGLHPRLMGQAGRANALREFLQYAQSMSNVWFARRTDIAQWWLDQHPVPAC